MVMGVVVQAEPTSALSLPGSSPEEKWEKLDPSSRESLTFWAFSIQRTFWASHGLCLACDIEFLSVPGHPIAHTLPQHWPCGFGSSAQGIPGSARLAKPTYSVPYKPVPHVSLNQSQRLPCLAGTRAVCFFPHGLSALFVSQSLSAFFCVYSWRLKVCLHQRIVLMHSKGCEFPFGRDIQHFSRVTVGGKDKISKTTKTANTPAEVEIFVCTIWKAAKSRKHPKGFPSLFSV